MSQPSEFETQLRGWRLRRGWSQEELARRSALSRAGVSAIETGRLVPSAAAALALAEALECRVEDLFRLRKAERGSPTWAWAPRSEPCRYWTAEVGGALRLYPAESGPLGLVPHDGVAREGTLQPGEEPGDPARTLVMACCDPAVGLLAAALAREGTLQPGEEPVDPERTLVMACCDPAVGLLAAELAREAGLRLLVFQRPSRAALALLGQGLVHAAGVHLSRPNEPGGNAGVVRGDLGPGYSLLRVAHWEEGVALTPGLGLTSVGAAIESNLRWIGRENGSGARQCLDELLAGRRPPRRVASDHRGVAEALRGGWADAGVCLRLVSEEAGLDFLGVRQEAYDLCFPTRWEDDSRLKALVQAVRSPGYRRTIGDLPGYDSTAAGDLAPVR